MKSIAICALISGLIFLIYGLYLMIFKNIITNKDIVIVLFFGFAYIGYMFGILTKRW